MFDTHGQNPLKGKIIDIFKEKTKTFPEGSEDIKEVLVELTKLTDDMISTIDGCVSHRPKRLDIAEIYGQVFHKELCELLSRI